MHTASRRQEGQNHSGGKGNDPHQANTSQAHIDQSEYVVLHTNPASLEISLVKSYVIKRRTQIETHLTLL
jgi:hypothetical protein